MASVTHQFNFDQIPAELRNQNNWVAWRSERRRNKTGKVTTTKVLYSPLAGKNAKSNDPSTWVSYDQARTAFEHGETPKSGGRPYDGIGFCLSDGYVGVDLDGVHSNGILEPWAEQIVQDLNCYAELSPSREGVRMIVKAELPDGRREYKLKDRDHHGAALYDAFTRFLTMTGWRIRGGSDIPERTEEIRRIHARLFPPEPKAKPQIKSASNGFLADDELIARARAAKNGAKFSRLWDGRWEDDHSSQSEADLGLCGMLAFWTDGDAGRMDALFRRSGLFRDKWERPEYLKRTIEKVLANQTEGYGAEESIEQLPASTSNEFELRTDGLYWINPDRDKNDVYLCSRLKVIADMRNSQNRAWSRLVEMRDSDGVTHQVSVHKALFAGDEAEIRKILLDAGADLSKSKEAQDKLSLYLRTARVKDKLRSISRIGWHGDVYILPDREFPSSDSKRFFLEWPAEMPNLYAVKGTLDDWRRHIAQLAVNNSRLTFAICCGFAGPLLKRVGLIGGGIHLVGLSSRGKSTAALLAGSVCGGGGKLGFGHSWKATINALEPMCEAHNDSILILDEIREADPYKVVDAAYMIVNGVGKARQAKTLHLRSTAEWTTAALSSGEETLEQIAAGIGSTVPGGASVCMLAVPADAGAVDGIFADLHSAPDGEKFSIQLCNAARIYFGTAIRPFLERLVQDLPSVERRWPQFREDFRTDYLPKGAGEELGRAAQFSAILAYAGTLATEWNITGWPEEEAYRAAGTCFAAHCKHRGSLGPRDIEQGIAHVRLLLEQFGTSRFAEIKPGLEDGTVSEDRILTRYGYRKQQADGSTEYWISPEVWRSEFCKGRDAEEIARELRARRHLRATGKHLTCPRRVPGLGQLRFYVIKSSFVEDKPSEPSEQLGASSQAKKVHAG